MEWAASTLTPPPNVVYPALLKLMRKLRLPAVDWTDAPTDLNGLVRFGERRNLVSARVPSRSARAILSLIVFNGCVWILFLSFLLACLFLFLFLALFLVDIFLVCCYFYLSVADVAFHVYINLFFFLSFLLDCNTAACWCNLTPTDMVTTIFCIIFCGFKDIPFHWAWFNMCLILMSV